MLMRIAVATIATVALNVVAVEGWWRFASFLVVYLIIGYDILYEAVEGIVHGEVFDENFPICTFSHLRLSSFWGLRSSALCPNATIQSTL